MTARRLAVLWTVTIVVGCLIPGNGLPSLEILSYDKVIHVLLFVGFGWLWTTAFPRQAVLVLISGIALGIAIEVAQGALPINRSPDVFDAIADVVGLLIGMTAGRWAAGRRRTA